MVTHPAPAGRRVQAANWLFSLKVTEAITRLPRRPCLIILTYHRIGHADATPFDPNVFSATGEQFEQQVDYLRRRFPILRLQDAVDAITGRAALRQAAVLLTFDDGYLDNYEVAYPILRKLGVPATFFLPTSYIGTSRIPWWDELAWYVRNATVTRLAIEYPRPHVFDLTAMGSRAVLQALLRLYKTPSTKDPDRLMREVAEASHAGRPSEQRLFMDWTEAAAMIAGGMDIGSHTHSHDILSRLSREHQEDELRLSRAILEDHLGTTIDTLAYPVGGPTTYNADTFRALEATGYVAAFSHDKSDVNRPGHVSPYNILRLSVGPDTPTELIALRVSTAAVTGRLVV